MKYLQEHIYFLSSAHISFLKKIKMQFNLPDYLLAHSCGAGVSSRPRRIKNHTLLSHCFELSSSIHLA